MPVLTGAPLNDALIFQLYQEQTLIKHQFDQHIRYDYLGVDNSQQGKMNRYEYLKTLAARIIHIEDILTDWASGYCVTELAKK